jgi:sporulation protein YabP
MAYEGSLSVPHRVVLEDRRSLTVSGVTDVERFDEHAIVLSTARGAMVVSGEQLHIEKLSLDGGDLKVEGEIESLSYEEERSGEREGFWARLLR